VNEPQDVDQKPKGVPLVSVRNVSKVFGHHQWGRRTGEVVAVDDLSFDIYPGETFGLAGESGSGKTTMSRMLLRIERPTAGSITFAGSDVWSARRSELRQLQRDIQIVFQNPVASLNRRQTVRKSLVAPLEVHRVGTAKERRRRIDDLLEMVGLNQAHADSYPNELSGGQCQRVAIARSLALAPRLIVLDEAVAAVDVSIRAQILNLLRDLQSQTGVAYLFISHDLSIMRYMAPRLGVMQRGKLVEMGTREEIFTSPKDPYTQSLLAAVPEPDPREPFPLRGQDTA
jgi:oligopeptide transport system ATP-binding protein